LRKIEGGSLVRFVVIGEGWPANALLDVLVKAPGASIDALVLERPENNPLAEFARRHNIPVVDVTRFSAEADRLAGRPPAWLVNVNSTFIIPPPALKPFERQSLNFHPGLLPEYAGLHTHQWAIRNGEREFGVTVHRMEERIDTGAIVGQTRFAIRLTDTGLSLLRRCLTEGAELFTRVVTQVISGETLIDVPQDLSRRRLYRHREALDGRIDWNEAADRIVDFIRAGNYEPLTSPTYVARLDPVAGFDIEVLRASKEGLTRRDPGTVVDVSASGPLIACDDGNAIRIVRARSGQQAMTTERWQTYISHLESSRLLGRNRQP
jgi:methionyl-tRNA formyltransferase